MHWLMHSFIYWLTPQSAQLGGALQQQLFMQSKNDFISQWKCLTAQAPDWRTRLWAFRSHAQPIATPGQLSLFAPFFFGRPVPLPVISRWDWPLRTEPPGGEQLPEDGASHRVEARVLLKVPDVRVHGLQVGAQRALERRVLDRVTCNSTMEPL